MAPNTMTPGQARVVDPVLSTHARGYSNAERTGNVLFPRVPVPARGARVLRFGKESFRLYAARRAPGANTKRVQFGYAADPISVVQESLEGLVPFEIMEEADQLPNVDLGREAVDMVMESLTLNLEVEQAKLATDPDQYATGHKVALSGSDKWTSPDSDPGAQMREYKETVRRAIGRYPNTLQLSPDAFNALAEHPKIQERFKFTSSDSLTAEMLARYFQLDRVSVGMTVVVEENDNDARDVWENVGILAWTPRGQNWRVPSFGYTYELPGMPMVEEPYQDRNAKSWLYPTTYERRAYLTGPDAGFLIQAPA